ncbi:GNAT family N-acetyltransferase [Planococcus sp. CP5-4]|uniref:GNAT family N-acetyltransferase n=1 Tax=unclassified Planococcus (in: firmicutes) TaxID=2662419 RepID=UPI001C21ADD1|nr:MULTISPECIES: GNAT family N-acetyltransferase [unclassified Planococcus (in: firmicutes)]MBU9673142.1 GNAT family N-acetyltransferase [Planococcus sp. CP5-4_YE]MBW6062450.1 GNAT family N-acetyltransferase [Planococcus sp. CP5-4]
MITIIDPTDEKVARDIQSIQRPAYRIEAELMGFHDIPHISETIDEIQQSEETFLGYQDGYLKGFISYKKEDDIIDIYRLVVDPLQFRQGIARSLVDHLLKQKNAAEFIVSTGTANVPARKLYESFGFREEETFEVAPGVTCTQFRLVV